MPLSYDLTKTVNLEVVPEIDAAVDQDGLGRHFAASTVVGLGFDLTDKLTLEVEGQMLRDDDPSGKSTQELASVALAYKANENLQLDIGGVAGLNRDAPDVELYAGVSRRF